ncbi:MAG: hypothetical protein HY722_09670, partial [Planctomycetes bacterium]|nr:hypothetical protein [Planctomycetota bacterium]
ELARYLPNVRSIRVLEREELSAGPRLHNLWEAEARIPRVAAAFIKPTMLQWDDHARWKDRHHLCEWTIATRFFTEQVRCQGTNSFHAEGREGTRVVLAGELTISLEGFPGVPRALRSVLEPQVERFAVALILPNLRRVNEALERFLDEEG